jgi:hypothetical protein
MQSLRPWRQIAEQVCEEHDSDRLLALCKELEQALEEQVAGKREPMPNPRLINDSRRSA